MEWKKEKISAAELERSRKEYMSAAMNMMKRSDTSARTGAPAESTEPAPAVEITQSAEITQAVEVTQTVDITPPEVTEPAEETPETSEPPETSETSETPETPKIPEAAPAAEGPSGPVPEEECKQAEELSGEGDSYGVYTAEELLKADKSDDGLKKAAEILEEMTRNTAIMKRLAADSDDADTTDFPDFSCDTDDCSFRDGYATDSASEQLTKSDTPENE